MLIPPSYFFESAYREAWGLPPGAGHAIPRHPHGGPPSVPRGRRMALMLAAGLEWLAGALRRRYGGVAGAETMRRAVPAGC